MLLRLLNQILKQIIKKVTFIQHDYNLLILITMTGKMILHQQEGGGGGRTGHSPNTTSIA